MKILIIDNYDSFTYNLVHIVEQFVEEVHVIRNDNITDYCADAYDKIIISPGPGLPQEANMLMDFIRNFKTKKSILGICLGHQALGVFFGLRLRNIKNTKHGEHSVLTEVDFEESLFRGLKNPVQVGHYHSWVIDHENAFNDWRITAKSDELIMAISHKKYDLKGVQFHPESILTPYGKKILHNWICD